MDEVCKSCGTPLPDSKNCTACGQKHAYVCGIFTPVADDSDVYRVWDGQSSIPPDPGTSETQ